MELKPEKSGSTAAQPVSCWQHCSKELTRHPLVQQPPAVRAKHRVIPYRLVHSGNIADAVGLVATIDYLDRVACECDPVRAPGARDCSGPTSQRFKRIPNWHAAELTLDFGNNGWDLLDLTVCQKRSHKVFGNR
jgi:hypothetical protein